MWQILNIEFLLSGISDFKISSFPESKFVNAYLELSIIGLFFFISIFIVKLLFCKAKKFLYLKKSKLINNEPYL